MPANYGNIIWDAHKEHKLTFLSLKNKTEKYTVTSHEYLVV